MLREAKVALVLGVAAWGAVGLLQNFVDWNGTFGAVSAATSMTTIPGAEGAWQATDNAALVWLGVLFILVSKAATTILCSLGGVRMWRARHLPSEAFAAAKLPALTGCTVAVFMLFVGFTVIAESWYELWRSDALRAPVLESAFRYAGSIALIGLFVGQPEPEAR